MLRVSHVAQIKAGHRERLYSAMARNNSKAGWQRAHDNMDCHALYPLLPEVSRGARGHSVCVVPCLGAAEVSIPLCLRQGSLAR